MAYNFQNLQQLIGLNRGPNVAQRATTQTQKAGQQQQQNIAQQQQNIGTAQQFDMGQLRSNVEAGNQAGIAGQLNAKYTGPQAGTINAQAKNLQNLIAQGQALGSTGGQQALLQQQYGRPDYSKGMSKFDAGLQARNQAFQQQAAEAKTKARQLQQQNQAANIALNTQAGTTEAGQKRLAEQTRQGIGTIGQEIYTGAQQRADEANKADIAQYQAYQDLAKKLGEGKASADVLEKLGLSSGERLYGVNAAEGLKYSGGVGQTTAQDVLSQPEYQKFSMLQNLLGDTSQVFDPTKVGSYQAGQIGYDPEKLKGQIAERKSAYEKELEPTKSKMDTYANLMRLRKGQITQEDIDKQGDLYNMILEAERQNVAGQQGALGQTPWGITGSPAQQALNQRLAQLGLGAQDKLGMGYGTGQNDLSPEAIAARKYGSLLEQQQYGNQYSGWQYTPESYLSHGLRDVTSDYNRLKGILDQTYGGQINLEE